MTAILASILVSVLMLVFLLLLTKDAFSFSVRSFSMASIGRLLVECFPLCLGAFLLIYLGNAPKYAIGVYQAGFSKTLRETAAGTAHG